MLVNVTPYFDGLRLIAERAGFRCSIGGTGVLQVISGTPVATLNGVFCSSPAPDPDQIGRFAAELPGTGLPWTIQLRGEPSAEVAAIASEHGLTGRHTAPYMTCGRDAFVARGSRPYAPVIRAITSARLRTYVETLTAGFEAPPDVFARMLTPQLLDAPGMTAYLAERDGIPVAAAFGVLHARHIGVFNVGTPPIFRGRGYARLIVEQVMRDGFAAGAESAYLQASKAGFPLYESMGFTTAETWTYLVAPAPQ